MLLDQMITVDALAVVALAAAVVVRGHRVAKQASEAHQTLLRRFASGELDLSTYEREVATLDRRSNRPSPAALLLHGR